jgi:hypothetical protein
MNELRIGCHQGESLMAVLYSAIWKCWIAVLYTKAFNKWDIVLMNLQINFIHQYSQIAYDDSQHAE